MILAALLLGTSGFSVTPNYNWKTEEYSSLTIRKSRSEGILVSIPVGKVLAVTTATHRRSGHELIVVDVDGMRFPRSVIVAYSRAKGFRLIDDDVMMGETNPQALAHGEVEENSFSHFVADGKYPHGTPMHRLLTYDPKTDKMKAGDWRKRG